MLNTIISTSLALSVLLSPGTGFAPLAGESGSLILQDKRILASETLDLSNRYPVVSVSEGFKENILIAVSYFERIKNEKGLIVLNPGEIFAFHKNILPEYKGYKIITQESGFVAKDGYKYVSGLAGNGVCHLASLMNKTALKAGLEVVAPTSHDFATIPGIEREFGTSIKYFENGGAVSERQNLYIKNNFDHPVGFLFSAEGDNLRFTVVKVN